MLQSFAAYGCSHPCLYFIHNYNEESSIRIKHVVRFFLNGPCPKSWHKPKIKYFDYIHIDEVL